jgi:DNA-binding transcriptional regulator GbsR (MarR family)
MEKPAAADPAEYFIEQMGLLTQSDGLPRISGRIFGLLLVEGRPFTLQEMSERLKISKASASTNARMLAGRGMLRLTAHAGDRQDYYELVPSPYHQMVETVSAKMRRSAGQIAEAEAMFPENSGAKARVRQLAEFYRQSADFMADWSKHLKL